MNILVTGGAGMIGSNLVQRLARDGHQVRVVDNLWRGRREFLAAATPFDPDRDLIVEDLSRPGVLEPLLEGVDCVYHLADVVAGIDYVFRHQGEIFRQNVLINSNVIASIRARPVRAFVYVGTACSFPAHLQTGPEAPPLREDQQYPAHPESAYGWSKLMGEYEAFLLEREAGVPVSVLSLHNVYGAPCEFGPRTSQVIPALIRKALLHPREPFVVWGSGRQGRAFVHVDDVVEGLVLAASRGLGHGVIQLGPDVCTSIREVAERVVRISGKPIDIAYDTSKPEGDRGRCADYRKAREVLGWTPRVTLDRGLADLYRWIADRLAREA